MSFWKTPALLCVALVASPAAAIDDASAQLLTNLLTVELAKDQRLEVLSSTDVARVLDFESDKQTLGCDESAESCLLELAGALDARWVVFGEIGELGSQVFLTMSVFDSEAAKAAARVRANGETVDEIVKVLPARTEELAQAIQLGEGKTGAKVIVLDLRAPAPPATEPTERPEGTSALTILGVSGIVLGAVAAGTGGLFAFLAEQSNEEALNKELTQVEAQAAFDARDQRALIANIGLGVGAGLAVVSVVALLAGGGE